MKKTKLATEYPTELPRVTHALAGIEADRRICGHPKVEYCCTKRFFFWRRKKLRVFPFQNTKVPKILPKGYCISLLH
jgi:hypothetical protein